MTRAFDKVLIANRGEIACRVIAACREAGLKTVAVHSDVDRDAPHVRLADQAVAIGAAAPAESYLSITRIIEAALASGAGALHPGYGFRAESAELAEAAEARGIVFIGPTPKSLRELGDKRAARDIARAAGVPVVPGYEGDPAGALPAALAMGFPVMVKAAMGGGGKGMRRIDDPASLAEALESAARVAASAFGDASVYLERYVEGARHIEVQLLGDGQGGARHLFERECSLQRRHQKVIEETPSPALDAALRAAICDAALRIATGVRYRSAGTAEFLLAPDRSFYFLEMNTRIQVEHPVTEMTTGVDLVRAQIELALGGQLPADEWRARGHAVEARLTAEDVAQGFLPQSGPLLRFDLPRTPFLRIDTGYEAGSAVPMEYDSLLAKIIAWGPDRHAAFERLRIALDNTVVHGVRTNLPLLRHLVRHPKVLAGELSTHLLEAELLEEVVAAEQRLSPLLLAAVGVAETLAAAPATSANGAAEEHAPPGPFQRLGRFRMLGLD